MIYRIEHRIETLTRNAVGLLSGERAPSFLSLDISFSHWEFSWSDAWKQDYWLASSTIEAATLDAAYREFSTRLSKIIPKISLLSQCYVQHLAEPFLIHRTGSDIALVKYVTDVKGVGLMFQEDHLDALNTLLDKPEIPEEFYYYWNDAVNTVGYSSKLLSMFSAIEALVKPRPGVKKRKEYWERLEFILGAELKTDLFGTKENPEGGLRHRLVHGEYFDDRDNGKDHVELIHKKIIRYFNESIFGQTLIHENVVRPHRTFWGNKETGTFFVKAKNSSPLALKDFLCDVKANDLYNLTNYDFVYDPDKTAGY